MSDLDQTAESDRRPLDDPAPPTQPPPTDPISGPHPLETRSPDSYPDTRHDPDSLRTRAASFDQDLRDGHRSGRHRDGLPGDFPGYDLLEVLGEGGMGVVYQARQVGLNRLVALKVILGGRRAGPKDLIRFLAEAEAVASIKHPNVVQVHEYGEADGRPFLAMEYLPGGSLADRLKREGRLAPIEAAGLVARLARAVQAAHDQGIVHRDLKPANILFDAEREPKVTDFGLAKRSTGNDLTQTQAVMGTPAYMSPEQAQGKTKFVGPPADVYALGVILYECLAGRRPFHDDDTHVLLRQVIEDEPKPPTRHVAGLPRDLELIALKCLSKDQADRYPTAGALAQDLGRFVAGEPVTVRAARLVERTLKWARRKPSLAIAYTLTAIVAMLLAFGASLAVLWQSAERARATSEEVRQRVEGYRWEVEIAREKLARVEYGRTIQVAHQEWRDNKIVASLALLGGTRPDLRGWEWRYVERICHGELLELSAQAGTVGSVAWSPDGSRLATADKDGTARIWDAKSGAEIHTLRGHALEVASVSWSPDGSRIATAGWDKTARVWDTKSGVETLALRGHLGEVISVSWSPDGSRIATAGADATARVWDARTGVEELVLKGHTEWVASVSWSPDGSRIATASRDRTARVWDARSGVEVFAIEGHHTWVTSISWSPDGSRLATSSWDDTARIWDARTGVEKLVLRGHTLAVSWASWSPDGSRIATASGDGTARIWEADTGVEKLTLKGHARWVGTVSWSSDGSRIATSSLDGTARVWDARISAEALVLKGHKGNVNSASWSPDGSRIATAGWDSVKVWDPRNGVKTLGLDGEVTSVSWSPDGSRIATAGADGTARIWDARTGAESLALKGHSGRVNLVAWNLDGSRLATASVGGPTRVWDAGSGVEIFTLEGRTSQVNAAAWSSDGSRIATADSDGTTRVWDAANGSRELELNGHDGEVTSVSWTRDGSRIATAGADGTARVWDMLTGNESLTLKGHTERVTSVSWSPNESRIVTAGADGTTRVWDSESGAEVLTLKGHSVWVTSACWSPDGSQIATTSHDGTARIWDARIGPGPRRNGPSVVGR